MATANRVRACAEAWRGDGGQGMSGIDDVKRSLAEWCAVAAERTAEAAKVTSRRYDKFALGREIEKRYAELGALVHQGLKSGAGDVLGDPRVAVLCAEVDELEAERERKEEEISGIRREYAERRGEADPADTRGGAGGGAGGDADDRQGRPDSGDRRPDFSD